MKDAMTGCMKHGWYVVLMICFALPAMAQHPDALILKEAAFTTGDSLQWASPGYSDQHWKRIKAGEVWQSQGFPDYHGYGWYRMKVVIPRSLKQQAAWKDSLRIYLAHVNDVDETWLNGVRIGQTGSFPHDIGGYVSKWPYIREYHIPAADKAIRWDAENVIAVRVFDGGGTGGIFMGTPYVDLLRKIDGIRLTLPEDQIIFSDKKTALPVRLTNLFNTTVKGTLRSDIFDLAAGKKISSHMQTMILTPESKGAFIMEAPHRAGIRLRYCFTETATGHQLKGELEVPYLQTPAPAPAPRINSAPVYGVSPGTPVIFKVAATGTAPLHYHASGLPEGLMIDSTNGVITGVIKQAGNYRIGVTVTNVLGVAAQSLLLKAGGTIALTPPMGWNSWNCWGLSVSEDKVKSSAQALLDKGLADHGWNYINVDDGWQQPQRAADSSILPNGKFPDMKGLGDWLHSRGLKFGMYSSPGPLTCGGFLGSYRNEEKDAATYANWGIDYLKYDWCSYDQVMPADTSLETFIHPFRVMQQAIRKYPRDIVYNLCQYGLREVWKWGPQVDAQTWRTTEDIDDTWESMAGIGFGQYPLEKYARPGNWNDPDMMIVGQVGWGENLHPTRLTPDEQYTHVSLWSLLAAPLLIGCDISRIDTFTLNLLTNDEVLAIDQDTLGVAAGRRIATAHYEVWVKPLADGSKAIGIFNKDRQYRHLTVPWKDINLSAKPRVRNVWTQRDLGVIPVAYTVDVPPHGVVLLRCSE
ncbi:Putative Ig domain-containing protein [Chitinophaga ginsengisegetis]|uniref:Alpha-galactosidase n=1 Tax=Chitinophaga ginsengisegetis TaxID=393003 RepID=A0A1T5NA14_9BACT|nr:putative Ig domain-containing protein [Chitinophaga ginsengisegetis]SKC97317.1 Putative Ig domain-containing protein [Chitinophaga ginsengisegetis]